MAPRSIRTFAVVSACFATVASVLWAATSPVFSARVIRLIFDKGGRKRQEVLKQFVPKDGFVSHDNVRYRTGEPQALMDIAVPAPGFVHSAAHQSRSNANPAVFHDEPATSSGPPVTGAQQDGPYPAVVWIHGGAWLAGTKDDNSDYLRLLSTYGFVTASVDYPLAPESAYPRATHSVLRAIAYLVNNAELYDIDPHRIVLAGDSAGAQLAMQAALAIVSEEYRELTGFTAPIDAQDLKGVVAFCGAFDFADETASPTLQRFFKTVLWAYSRTRRFENHDSYRHGSIVQHVVEDLPPVLVDAGNKDFLLAQSRTLVKKLRAVGVDVEESFYPENHPYDLVHEYQFDLRREESQQLLEKLVDFLRRTTGR